MNDVLIVLLTLLLGVGCGYFQYWMTTRLGKKRWLLLLQPVLLAVVTVCFTAWTLSIQNLPDRYRLASAPFAVLLLCTAVGWAIGERKRRRP